MEKDKKTIAQKLISLRILPTRLGYKILMGILFIVEAQAEVQLGFLFIPKYYVQIVTPLNILWIASSLFATSIGALSFGVGLVQYFERKSIS